MSEVIAQAPVSAPSGSGETTTTPQPKTMPSSQGKPDNVPIKSEGAEAPKEGAEAKVAEAIRRHKLKIDDQEIEIDDEELKRGYQRARAANKKFEESVKIRREMEAAVEQLKKNPIDILSRLGVDLRQLSYNYLKPEIEKEIYEALPAEEKAKYDLERKAKAYDDMTAKEKAAHEAKLKAEKEAVEHAEREKMQTHYMEDYNKKFISALENSPLPKTKETVVRMINHAKDAVERGFDLEASDIVELVKEDYIQEMKALVSHMAPEQLFAIFGEETANKIRKYDLARLRGSQSGANIGKVNTQNSEKPRQSQPKKLTTREFLEAARKRAGV